MSTTYTIQVINKTGSSKTYFLFQAPAPSPGGQRQISSNAPSAFESVTDGGFDGPTFTFESVGHEVPRFELMEGDYPPGQGVDPPKGATQNANVAKIDFTGLTQTTAVVTENPDGEFSVAYA